MTSPMQTLAAAEAEVVKLAVERDDLLDADYVLRADVNRRLARAVTALRAARRAMPTGD